MCRSMALQLESCVWGAASMTSRSSPSSTPMLCHNSVKHREDHAAPAPTGLNVAVLPGASSLHSSFSTNSHHIPGYALGSLPMNNCPKAFETPTSTISSVAARPADRRRRCVCCVLRIYVLHIRRKFELTALLTRRSSNQVIEHLSEPMPA